jgi:hypothetical protein
MREKETGDTELEEVNIQDIKKAAAAKRMNKKGIYIMSCFSSLEPIQSN